jgi:hypothetical protein
MMPDWKPEIRRRLLKLKLEPTREAAIIEELAQHLDESYAELLAGGVSEADAYRQVRAELHDGGLLTHGLRRVERSINPEPIVLGTNRRTNMIAVLWQDLRFGVPIFVLSVQRETGVSGSPLPSLYTYFRKSGGRSSASLEPDSPNYA